MWNPLAKRTTGEILVLMITATVCFSVIATGTFVAILVLIRPSVDVSLWVNRVTAVLNTLIGLLAGFLAGRTERAERAAEQQPPPPAPAPPQRRSIADDTLS